MDGFDVMLERGKEEEFMQICKFYEKKIGNSEMGNLEFTKFKVMYQLNISSYLGITESGELKKKGNAFITDYKFYDDPSARVIALALEAYFTKGIDPIQFITSHDDILDFCIRAKCRAGCHLETQYKDGRVKVLGKLLRYYLIADKGAPELFKRGIGTKDNFINSNENAPNELGDQRVCPFNQMFEADDYWIDYPQYILSTLKIISQIEGNRKDKEFIRTIKPDKQMFLF